MFAAASPLCHRWLRLVMMICAEREDFYYFSTATVHFQNQLQNQLTEMALENRRVHDLWQEEAEQNTQYRRQLEQAREVAEVAMTGLMRDLTAMMYSMERPTKRSGSRSW